MTADAASPPAPATAPERAAAPAVGLAAEPVAEPAHPDPAPGGRDGTGDETRDGADDGIDDAANDETGDETRSAVTPEPAAGGELFDFVVVANRLPADCTIDDDGTPRWSRSPGGLVSALDPVMRERGGAWVGWAGLADVHFDPFDANGVRLIPVDLSRLEVERYYEGFSNDTLWPLYHDVIAAPSYHREWWLAYVKVNERFANETARVAAEGATVWVHDYQLQLVPRLLREQRPDLTIGFFNHIPFPPYGIFSQLPWRRQIIMGLLGADVVGFQRATDASNFQAASKRLNGATPETLGTRVKHVPISIDAASFDELGRDPAIIERAAQIRESYGGRRILFGVDRLDYTKGIGHRIKAFGELIASGQLDVSEAVLMQVASPSRERVGPYRRHIIRHARFNRHRRRLVVPHVRNGLFDRIDRVHRAQGNLDVPGRCSGQFQQLIDQR